MTRVWCHSPVARAEGSRDWAPAERQEKEGHLWQSPKGGHTNQRGRAGCGKAQKEATPIRGGGLAV
eukprot:5890459-Prymnesium_polylepis.1